MEYCGTSYRIVVSLQVYQSLLVLSAVRRVVAIRSVEDKQEYCSREY